jgi:heme exporter protein C
MLYPLLLMILAFYSLFALTLLLNMRAELLWTHRDSGWLKQLVGDT